MLSSLSLARNALFRKSAASSMMSMGSKKIATASSLFSLRNLIPFEYTVKYKYTDGTGKKTINKVWTNVPPPSAPPASFCDSKKAKLCPRTHQKCGGISGLYGHGTCTRSFSITNRKGKNEIVVSKEEKNVRRLEKSQFTSERDHDAQNEPTTAADPVGLDEYLRTTWKYTGYNLGMTAAGSAAGLLIGMGASPILGTLAPPIIGVGYIASFGYGLYSAYKINAIEPVYERDHNNTGVMRIKEDHESNIARLGYANKLFLAQGVTLIPALTLGLTFNVLPQALLATAAATAGPIAASLMLPKEWSLTQFESVALTALLGVVGAFVGGIWIPVLHDISTYGGVLVFTFLNAYDTHVAIEEYGRGRPDYVGHSVNYGLNIINLFVRFIEILAKSKK